MSSKYGKAIGIDLGTTNLCVGVYNNETESVEIIPNRNGNKTTPSYVSFLDGQRIVGEEAKNSIHLYPDSTCYDTKRFMGKKFMDEGVQEDMSHMSYNVSSDNNGKILFNMKLYNSENDTSTIKNFYPQEISAMLLEYMKNISEEYIGCEIKDAVITVPAYFNDAQRSSTKDSAIIAGLNPLRIINEPTSASLCYGFADKNTDSKILVFDIGGGTFDVSILEISDGLYNVLSTNGNTHLGGEDFDRVLVSYFVDKWNSSYKDIKISEDSSDYLNIMGKLKEIAERTKKSLSTKLAERVLIEYRGKVLNFNISRKIFEDLCTELFIKCKLPVETALIDAGLNKCDIDEIVLVGGSTRIPKICKMLQEMFDGKTLNRSVNPDEAVAYGATIQATSLSKSDLGKNNRTDLVLVDVIPLSLGIRGYNGTMSKIINKNTNIPYTAKGTYTTVDDNQESVVIEIYEGEREFVVDNHLLGKFELCGIQRASKGVPKIEVSFNVDENGILNVKAIDLKTLEASEIIISNDHGLSSEEIQIMIKDAESNRERDSLRRELVEYANSFHEYLDNVLREVNNSQNDILDEEEISSTNILIMNNKDWLDEILLNTEGHTKEELENCKQSMKYYLDPVLNKIYARKVEIKKEVDNMTDTKNNLENVINSLII